MFFFFESKNQNKALFGASSDPLRCRYYENQYPEPDEVVMCSVTEISDIAVYVTLPEYDHIKVISYFSSSHIIPLVFVNYF